MPQANVIVREAHGDDGAANVAAAIQRLANEVEHELLPHQAGARLFHAQRPLAAALVGLVLPHGADAVPEEHEVCAALHHLGAVQVAVHLPKPLHSVKAPQAHVALVPGRPHRLLDLLLRPQAPLVVERVQRHPAQGLGRPQRRQHHLIVPPQKHRLRGGSEGRRGLQRGVHCEVLLMRRRRHFFPFSPLRTLHTPTRPQQNVRGT